MKESPDEKADRMYGTKELRERAKKKQPEEKHWIEVNPQPPRNEHIAPPGTIWVCAACGKTQRDSYGGTGPSYGWDESCALNAVLCHEQHQVKA